MTERPILFSGEDVRAILGGRKTQARRVVRPQPVLEGRVWRWKPRVGVDINAEHINAAMSPYGVPGDRLWVRETWAVARCYGKLSPKDMPLGPRNVWYRASSAAPDQPGSEEVRGKWRPSIHMPRWASRITLEITGVRVERVQEISEEDAVAEGIEWLTEQHQTARCRYHPPSYSQDGVCVDPGYCSCGEYSDIEHFRDRWDSINARWDYGWDADPWVWVIEFKVLTESQDGG